MYYAYVPGWLYCGGAQAQVLCRSASGVLGAECRTGSQAGMAESTKSTAGGRAGRTDMLSVHHQTGDGDRLVRGSCAVLVLLVAMCTCAWRVESHTQLEFCAPLGHVITSRPCSSSLTFSGFAT